MNRSGGSQWQEETPVAVGLVLSLAMLALALVALWVWPGWALTALL